VGVCPLFIEDLINKGKFLLNLNSFFCFHLKSTEAKGIFISLLIKPWIRENLVLNLSMAFILLKRVVHYAITLLFIFTLILL